MTMDPDLEHNPRYQCLDLWRGLFCLFVVLEHAAVALWPGAAEGSEGARQLKIWLLAPLMKNLGTPLFFVISGYCIAASVDASRRKSAAPWAFLGRRFWRIFPPYWMSVLGFVVLVMALDALGLGHWYNHRFGLELYRPARLDGAQWLGNLSLTETWRPRIFGGTYPEIYTRVGWALCYQEQFYLVCFGLFLLAPRRLYRALAATTAAIVAVRVIAWDSGALGRLDGLFPIYWHEFAVGLAVYWRLNVRASRAVRRAVDLGLVGLLAITARNGPDSTVAAAAFGLVLIALRRWDEPIGRLGPLEPLRSLGRRSYSIYLIHLPVCVLTGAAMNELGVNGFWGHAATTIPASLAGSLAVGWLFHHWIDLHFHKPPRIDVSRFKLPRPRPPIPATTGA